MRARAFIAISALAAAAACATTPPTYAELEGSDALRVSEVGDGVLVEATGRSGMAMEQLVDYALLSAAHAADARGRDSFLVADLQAWNERLVGQDLTGGYVAGDGNITTGAMSPTPGPRTPRVRLHAAFSGFGQTPDGVSAPQIGTAYATDAVIQELSARYEPASAESRQ